jgi:undecaprenyl-diphosphatase
VRRGLKLRHALALGLVQGPTELLPVSSSAHTILLPLLAGWHYEELDPELRKSFEVALHAGAGVALALGMRRDPLGADGSLGRRRSGVVALALLPPAIAGLALERVIERRLGGPRSTAAGLAGGALAMAVADARTPGGSRGGRGPGLCDGLALGLAQAAALAPGVSRNGAALTAARARGFGRAEAHALSRLLGLPVILGASALKGARLLERDGLAAGGPGLLAVGGGSAFLSTLASARLMAGRRSDRRSLLPYAVYRCLLAASIARQTRRGRARVGERSAIGAQ